MAVTRAHHPDDLTPQPGHTALLFDWDGTLADSQLVNYYSLRDALQGVGLDLAQEWFDARTGLSTTEMVQILAAESDIAVDVSAISAARDRRYLQRLGEVGEVRFVVDLLRAERSRRKTALATGGGADTVLRTVYSLELHPLFDAIVTRGDVSRGKPAPDIFLLAAEKLGADPSECLVYEDSDEGLDAATTAEMDAVDVRPLRTLAPGLAEA